MKLKYSDKFYTKMVSEFKIKDFDIFVNDVHKLFLQSCIYEFTNRISKVDDLNYGKPRQEKPAIGLSKEEIREQCRNLLVQSIMKYLPLQDIITNVSFDEGKVEGINEVKSILQRLENNTIIDTSSPVITKIEQRKPFQTDAQIAFKKLLKKQKPPVVDLGPPPKIVLPIDMPPYVEPEPVIVKEIIVETPSFGGGGGPSYRPVNDFDDGIRAIDLVYDRRELGKEYIK
jgi:hypothetical protein